MSAGAPRPWLRPWTVVVGARGLSDTRFLSLPSIGWTALSIIVALAAVIIVEALLASSGAPAHLIEDGFLACGLLWLSVIDIDTGRLPDKLTIPLGIAGVAASWFEQSQPWDGVIGFVAGWTAFLIFAKVYQAWRGRPGLGGGDAKLLAVGGAWLGWETLPWLVLLASLAALLVAVMIPTWRFRLARNTAIPFGPFLSAAILALRVGQAWANV